MFTKFFRDREAATAIEYGLIGGLVSVAIMASVTSLSEEVNVTYDTIESSMTESSVSSLLAQFSPEITALSAISDIDERNDKLRQFVTTVNSADELIAAARGIVDAADVATVDRLLQDMRDEMYTDKKVRDALVTVAAAQMDVSYSSIAEVHRAVGDTYDDWGVESNFQRAIETWNKDRFRNTYWGHVHLYRAYENNGQANTPEAQAARQRATDLGWDWSTNSLIE